MCILKAPSNRWSSGAFVGNRFLWKNWRSKVTAIECCFAYIHYNFIVDFGASQNVTSIHISRKNCSALIKLNNI